MGKKIAIAALVIGIVLVAVGFFAYSSFQGRVAPMPAGDPLYVRYESGTTLDAALNDLQAKGVVRDVEAAKLKIRLDNLPSSLAVGTFEVKPGMTVEQVMTALQEPVVRMVRIPEGWWIKRAAERLEKEGVCPAADYIAYANNPAEFKDDVSFPLPEGSLEGYLYPDTYDLPPLLPVRDIIVKQLKAFESKVYQKVENPEELPDAIIKASIIELEAGVDEERAKIAGVIENRIRDDWRLEMDASVLYALQEWKVLGPGEVRKVKSPYNTYLNAGLPPGPIGSPSAKSIFAALEPQSHNLYFYVARPDRTHLFATTYDEHRANINKARAEWRAKEAAEQ